MRKHPECDQFVVALSLMQHELRRREIDRARAALVAAERARLAAFGRLVR